MGKARKVVAQSYPRIADENSSYHGYIDDKQLKQHSYKIPVVKIKDFIKSALSYANEKSGRVILDIPDNASQEEIDKIYIKKGKELFVYFKKYCGDPASTAYDLYNKHYNEICKQQFYNRTLQKERMNSGWRYQNLVISCANNSKRFDSVSDIGTAEADFNASINYINDDSKALTLYVSVKNRTNTMGGQDWPKAIFALEDYAINDKNRNQDYCCVFGIVMEKGERLMKCRQKTGQPYSVNTEVWKADYFWQFFSNYTYENIMKLVLDTLIEMENPENVKAMEVPDLLIETFGKLCYKAGLVNKEGIFDNPEKLVSFFCI